MESNLSVGVLKTQDFTNKQEAELVGEHGKSVSWLSFLSLKEGMVCPQGACLSKENCGCMEDIMEKFLAEKYLHIMAYGWRLIIAHKNPFYCLNESYDVYFKISSFIVQPVRNIFLIFKNQSGSGEPNQVNNK